MNPSYFKDNVNDMKRVWRHTGFSSSVRNFSLVGLGVSLDHLNHFPRGCAPREMIEMVLGDSLPTQEKSLPLLEKPGASLIFSCHYINENYREIRGWLQGKIMIMVLTTPAICCSMLCTIYMKKITINKSYFQQNSFKHVHILS